MTGQNLNENNIEETRLMYNPHSGKLADVPFSMVGDAIKDGLELTFSMEKDGVTADIPMSKMYLARQDGFYNSEVPTIISPYEQELVNTAPEKTIGEKMEKTFLSGGATDIRNMALAAAPMLAPYLGAGATAGQKMGTMGSQGVKELVRKYSNSPIQGKVQAAQDFMARNTAVQALKNAPKKVGSAVKKSAIPVTGASLADKRLEEEGLPHIGFGKPIIEEMYKWLPNGWR